MSDPVDPAARLAEFQKAQSEYLARFGRAAIGPSAAAAPPSARLIEIFEGFGALFDRAIAFGTSTGVALAPA